MLRKRILMLVGGSLLAASGAWADDLGYVDCSSHSDDTPVFGKARKSPDQVATVACGERFTVLLNGFIFSRIETKDGKIGYIYSNYISVDRGATSAAVRQPDTGKLVETTTKVAIPSERQAQPKPLTVAQSRPATAQPKVVEVSPATLDPAPAVTTPAASSASTATPAPAQPSSEAPAQSQPAASLPAPAEVVISSPSPAPLTAAPASSAATEAAAPAAPAPSAASATTPQAASDTVTETPAAAPEVPAKPEVAQPAPQPQPAAAQPEPAPQPLPPPVHDASVRTSWEKPNPGARKPFALELYGGYAFTRFANGGPASNFNGGMGAFGWNVKPWLQIAGDTTYSYATISGTKNVLYGNHYGPRYFFRRPNRWNITPFVEGLIGGTRAETTVSGVGGYTSSANCISYKVGGGIDMHASRHLMIRVFDADYYGTSFGTNQRQNNWWISTGVVLQLFGGDRE
jgi:hypothetical protein